MGKENVEDNSRVLGNLFGTKTEPASQTPDEASERRFSLFGRKEEKEFNDKKQQNKSKICAKFEKKEDQKEIVEESTLYEIIFGKSDKTEEPNNDLKTIKPDTTNKEEEKNKSSTKKQFFNIFHKKEGTDTNESNNKPFFNIFNKKEDKTDEESNKIEKHRHWFYNDKKEDVKDDKLEETESFFSSLFERKEEPSLEKESKRKNGPPKTIPNDSKKNNENDHLSDDILENDWFDATFLK